MTLHELLGASGIEPDQISGDAEIAAIEADSRKIRPGALFVCMPGRTDSQEYISQARSSGAVAALIRDPKSFEQHPDFPMVLIRQEGRRFNESLAAILNAFYRDPTAHFKLIGVTGTNGKTTTARMIRDALAAIGRNAAYLGTLGFGFGAELRTLENTTPFPVELFQMLDEARRNGVQDFVMEVSSHALEEGRVAGLRFDVGIFTNLSQDHLDYHGSMEAYAKAKREFFGTYAQRSGKPFTACLNTDDPVGKAWTEALTNEGGLKVLAYGLNSGELRARPRSVAVDRIVLDLIHGGDERSLTAKVGGNFNVWNLLSASSGLIALGYGLDRVAEALSQVTPVLGRFEAVPNDRGIGILVDYAHTPDALEKLLDSVRELGPNRIITVFGCGGDRDRTKRPKMARSVSERSDFIVVTSDNPRTEDPDAIIEEIEVGLVPGKPSISIVDRREAIRYAVQEATTGDVVVIAGKGHEDYQIIGRTKHHMDDREMAREALAVRA